jgi:predicted naringenin-chalcone synthase
MLGWKVLESDVAALELPRQAFEHTWQVLADYGNMRWSFVTQLVSKTYRPDPVRRVMIPKHRGGERSVLLLSVIG